MAIVGGARKWLRLDAEERGLFLRAFLELGYVQVELKLRGFQRVLRRIEVGGTSSPRPITAIELARARRYAYWLELASRHHVVRAQCLQRSLVLHDWLRKEALPSCLRIGVRKEGDALKAHAWVELADEVVSDPPTAATAFQLLARPRDVRRTAPTEDLTSDYHPIDRRTTIEHTNRRSHA